MSVIVNAPAVFRRTAPTSPARHLEAAAWLGSEIRGARAEDAGEVLAARLVEIMRALAMPNGVSGVGYGEADVPALVRGTAAQERLLANAPIPTDADTLAALFRGATAYW
jgi:alcohol dehydrogenase class IV